MKTIQIIYYSDEYEEKIFREIIEENPIDIIKENVEKYIVALLNSGGGKIQWYEIDNYGNLLGFKLSDKEKDDLIKHITKQIENIKPKVHTYNFNFNFIYVLDQSIGNNCYLIENKYTLEINIKNVDSKIFYITSNQDVYIIHKDKIKKLSILEIQNKILQKVNSNDSDKILAANEKKVENIKINTQIQLSYNSNGELITNEPELYAMASEIIFIDSNERENIKINIDIIEPKLSDEKTVEYTSNLSPIERIKLIEHLTNLRNLNIKKLQIKEGIKILLSEKIFSYCSINYKLVYIWKGIGKIALCTHDINWPPLLVGLDLWYKKDSSIYTKVRFEVNSNEEKEKYGTFIGTGWYLFDLPDTIHYQYAIPAILLKLTEIKEQKKYEDIFEDLLNLENWYIGLS